MPEDLCQTYAVRLPAPASRSLSCVLLAVLLGATGTPASADPSAAPEPKPGKKLCAISDDRLREISGLVSTKNGYIGVADGSSELQSQLEVFELDPKCQVTERHSFQRDPFDPEDLAIAEDGTLWVADIGDNQLERDTVALWKIAPDRNSVSIYRLTYPDGKYDAEALLMQPDGTPVIVTKDLKGGGVSGIYVASAPLKEDDSVPLKKAGEFKLSNTGTGGNQFGVVGQKLVTGGAVSADGSRAVVRTYADAYEWKVTGGDIAKALTTGKPVRTPLPDEPQGESITYSSDGEKFITATEATTATEQPRLFSYTPAKPAPPKPSAKPGSGGPGWFSGLGLQDIKLIIAGFGVLGLVLVFLGVWGISRSRRSGGKDGASPHGPDDGPPDGRDGARGRASVRGPGRSEPTGDLGPVRGRGQRYGPSDAYEPYPPDPHWEQPERPAGRARVSRGPQGTAAVPGQPARGHHDGPVRGQRRGDQRTGGGGQDWSAPSRRPGPRGYTDHDQPPAEYWPR